MAQPAAGDSGHTTRDWSSCATTVITNVAKTYDGDGQTMLGCLNGWGPGSHGAAAGPPYQVGHTPPTVGWAEVLCGHGASGPTTTSFAPSQIAMAGWCDSRRIWCRSRW